MKYLLTQSSLYDLINYEKHFNYMMLRTVLFFIALYFISCGQQKKMTIAPDAIKPVVITEKVMFDTDDPAIWINPVDATKSLVIGTDKTD
ncbi:MAG: hypothetical protein QM775_33760 [Pirellulales bacterium]